MKKILFALSMLAFAVTPLPQARADMSIDFFYDNLSGGNWIEVEGYGYGWQPDVAVSDPNWRPYADGYWAYTDYGWTWISYEDFGWATYHYGRWANLADYGWIWIPGSDLEWGPAWVSWRTGGDYIGWAPLPPRGPGVVYESQPIGVNVDIVFDIGPEYYNFCDVRFIGEPVLRDRIFPSVQNVTYITNTVNVTNITVQNNMVYNYGPDFNVVNTYSSRPIQRLVIERQTPTNFNAAVKSGTLTKVQGNKLLVAAPQKLAKGPPSAKPSAVKAKVPQPKIERGWKGVANKAELEQKIKTENPKNVPPPTRAAAREAASPGPAGGTSPAGAAGGAAPSPGPRGRPGRVAPGATTAPSLGASPFERGKGKRSARPRPGATAMPEEGAGDVSPAPIEGGKPGGRPRPGMTAPPSGPREGVSPAPFERGKGRGRPGERSAEPGAASGPPGAARGASPSEFQSAPPHPEDGRPGRGRLETTPPSRQTGASVTSPEATKPPSTGGGVRPQRPQPRGEDVQAPIAPKTTQPPRHTGPIERGNLGPASRQPSTPPPGGATGEAHAQRERMQGTQAQQQQRRGAPASADHGQRQGQPEGGKKRQPKETPPPGPQ